MGLLRRGESKRAGERRRGLTPVRFFYTPDSKRPRGEQSRGLLLQPLRLEVSTTIARVCDPSAWHQLRECETRLPRQRQRAGTASGAANAVPLHCRCVWEVKAIVTASYFVAT